MFSNTKQTLYIQTLITFNGKIALFTFWMHNAVLLWMIHLCTLFQKESNLINVFRLWNDFNFPLMSQSLLSNHLTPFWYAILTFLRCNQFQSDKIEFNFEICPNYRGKMAVNTILCWLKGALENSGLQQKIARLSFTKCVCTNLCMKSMYEHFHEQVMIHQ